MRVVHISVTDKENGAHMAGFRLHQSLLRLGVDSTMFVMRRLDDSGDDTIRVYRGAPDTVSRAKTLLYKRWINRKLAPYRDSERREKGHFIYNFAPEGRRAVAQVPQADVIYIHAASGFLDYFRDLPLLALRSQIVFLLHDMSFFTGGCAHASGCERFVDRCGACPLFDSDNQHDLSRRVWEQKRALFSNIRNRLHFIAPSQWIAGKARRSSLLNGFPVEVIPNSVNTELFRPLDRSAMRALFGIPEKARVVGFLSDPLDRFVKGFRPLAEALQTMKDTRDLFLLTVGGGKPPVEIATPHLHLGRIHDDHLLSAFYSSVDIVALPSLDDNLPSVAMEAMACGIPIVAFATGGIPEMVEHGVTGVLVPNADIRALSEGISELLLDASARARMSENGRKTAVEQYSTSILAKRHVDFCSGLTPVHSATVLKFGMRKSARREVQIRQKWSIGIHIGTSPLSIHDSVAANNPVLTNMSVSDVQARFVADPFMIHADGRWFMFFEVFVETTNRGQIGVATSDDGLRWQYGQIVLREPFHLSYPYVFEWNGDYFMIPESYQAGSVRLYKADAFPTQWSFHSTLLDGGVFLDSSVVHYDGKWWLFAETNPQHKFDTLRLFYADQLTGPWREHPLSPIVSRNHHIARPAGRVQVIGGRLLRFAQDCHPHYGTMVRAFSVSELTTEVYRESECQESPILFPSGTGWNRSGMHHVDLHKRDDGNWIACVDGFVLEKVKAA